MKDLAYRNYTRIAVIEGDTSPDPGSLQTIAYSTTLNLLVKWNGISWQLLDDRTEFSVDYFIGSYLGNKIFNETAMTVDFSTLLTSLVTPVAGQTIYLVNNNDYTKQGIYILGSVASLSAVPVTRHPDWPGDRYLRKGMVFKSNYYYYSTGTYTDGLTTIVDPVYNSVEIPSWTAVGVYGTNLAKPMVRLFSTGSMPGGVTSGQLYWVKRISEDKYQLYTDDNFSTVVEITTAGTGTITIDILPSLVNLGEARFTYELNDKKLNDNTFDFVNEYPSFTFKMNAGTGISSIIVGNGIASGSNSITLGYTSPQANGYGSVAISGLSNNDYSITIGQQSISNGFFATAIGAFSRALNDNSYCIYSGSSQQSSSGDIEFSFNGSWHLDATTTNSTLTTCYRNKIETDLIGNSDLHGIELLSGYYFITGKAIAHNADRTKFTVWDIKGTAERNGYSSDPVLNLDFIPENSTGGTEELALKITPYVIPSVKEITVQVVGAASTNYYWNIELQFIAKEGYDYSAYTIGLASGKKTNLNYIVLPASESITAGAPVNIWNDSGTTKVRNANASNGRQADGFVGMTYGTGDSVVVFLSGNTSLLSGLTIGPVYLGTTAGTYSSSAPGTGNLVQRLGFATTTSNIAFIREPAIQT